MVFFTDFFKIKEETLDSYGAFNISLINDLPLFIDPFLLFGSKKEEYIKLHHNILDYLTFLKSKSKIGKATDAEIKSWYKFSEVKQNWLGYSVSGNGGSGLGEKFGKAMSANMHIVYDDLNKEIITTTSHLEKVGLFQIGVGKDNISDFSCNLLKSYLLEYTEIFAKAHLKKNQVKEINVGKVYFDYELQRWMPKRITLPYYNNDFIILTPKDLLTKDDNWINGNDLKGNFASICSSIPNDQLRSEIHNYFRSKLPAPVLTGKGRRKKIKKPTQKQNSYAINETIQKFPEILNYYIKSKEENKEGAKNISKGKVQEVEKIFNENVSKLINQLTEQSKFYEISHTSSFKEAIKRVEFLKDVIENKDGYRLFYFKGQPIKREADLQVIYRLTWYSSPYDVNREVNNGRGPVDYAVSKGAKDKTLVEFKLASNSKLKMNLENQVGVYEKASDTQQSIKVILYFDNFEYLKVIEILKELKLEKEKSIILIDSGNNKPSASNVK
ncbi:MAG: hypothetical protein A3F72_01390 [Bacteroidetes bacterium RIFCSPLOWO2_12_FULL_35_15]|nr:MAG: hypothetical protein A3F72_01390 [Bacteroidetes bacterium RIFCSPLOWO2_12_FULL_35_15]